MLEQWIAETTECDFKVAVEVKKPKSWLKSVSAFANGIGGTIFFGVNDQREIIGVQNVHSDTEIISNFIKERISPYPNFNLMVECIDNKDLIILTVPPGHSTPYYYKANGIMQAYIRAGNTSVVAPSYILNQLILKGMNRSYDGLYTNYNFKDYSFSKLRERYKTWVGSSMEEKFFDSFELRNQKFELTNAGALLADDSPIKQSRLFCTRWNGLDKSGGIIDGLDSAEYSGSLIILLNEGLRFIKRNMKTYWKKTPNSRIEMPDYCERSIFEALVNALIHRDYTILGSEIHIDIYDDHLTITSPGGMNDGTRIQERDIASIASSRRNPILADVFGRIGYMERQGSGFKKITDAYSKAHNFHDDLEPRFYSDSNSFQVTLFNLNYRNNKKDKYFNDKVVTSKDNELFDNKNLAIGHQNLAIGPTDVVEDVDDNDENLAIRSKKVAIDTKNLAIGPTDVVEDVDDNDENLAIRSKKVAIDTKNLAIGPTDVVDVNQNLAIGHQNLAIGPTDVVEDVDDNDENLAVLSAISKLKANQTSINKAKMVFEIVGMHRTFGRSDVAAITNSSLTSAGNLISKLKDSDLIETVLGLGKGKYKFIIPSTKK